MSLWYDCGNGFKRISFAKKNLGADVYLYAPGPSLKDVRNDLIHKRGVVNVAINTAYPHIHPDIWIGLDLPECYDHGLMGEPFVKICRSGYHNDAAVDGKLIKDMYNVFFADTREPEGEEQLFEWRGHDTNFVWHKNTLAFALHVLVWMGATKIHLVGTDLGGGNINEDYYDDRVLSPELRKRNKRLYGQQVEYLRNFNKRAKIHSIEMISCTPDSPINKFMPYVPLGKALSESEKKAPKPGGKVLHANEAHKVREQGKILDAGKDVLLQWNKEVYLSKGVMIGCDKNVEWMFDWWYANYRKHNNLPVMVVDLGMTKEKRQQLSTKVFVVDLPETKLDGWFNKPLAMIRSIFEKTIWIDIDCEIRGKIDGIFKNITHKSGMSVTRDPYNTFSKVDDPIQSGVVVFTHENKIITEWAAMVITDHKNYHGDQEVLDIIRKDKLIGLMPRKYNWLRLDGDTNKDAVIVHWTGKEGKDIIKRKMLGAFNREHFIAHLIRAKRWESGIELGVERGRTFLHLLRSCPTLKTLVGIDLFEAQPDSKGPEKYLPGENKKKWNHEDNYKYVTAEMKKIQAVNKSFLRGTLHKISTDEYAIGLTEKPVFDFVFIDADHSTEAVRKDIKNYMPRIKEDGYLIGHDIDWDTVREAVKELCPKFQKGPDNLWFIAKKDIK